MVVRPRSARIWLPIPHSRASAGKPSSRFASTVSRPCLLQLVRLELVEQADAAALLRHVEQDAALLALDLRQRVLELLAAVAAQRVEDVAGQALGVDADEHVLGAVDVALHERDVRLAGERLAVGDRGEVAVRGRQRAPRSCARRASRVRRRYSIRSATVTMRDAVPRAVVDEVGHAGHRPVVAHDLADDAGRVEPGEPRQVDGGLGLARAAAGRRRRAPCSGWTWPEWIRSWRSFVGSIATWIVRERSCAEMPVVTPSRASIVFMKAVPSGVSLCSVIGRRPSSSQRSSVRHRQMRPRACVAMKLIASGVANWAAMTRSPSFSRSGASTTTTNLPWRMSSIASSMVAKGEDTGVSSWSRRMIVTAAGVTDGRGARRTWRARPPRG